MVKLFKKSKENTLVLFIIIDLLVLAYLDNFKKAAVGGFLIYFILGSIGLSCLLWFKPLSHFDLKLDRLWSLWLPDKLISYKKQVRIYEVFYLVIGTLFFMWSCVGMLSLILN